MSFLSGETLAKRLTELVPELSTDSVDCSAIALRMGPEAVITDDGLGKKTEVKRRLCKREEFTIPPGQYAFLLTKESVRVPTDCMAFISLKTTYKFKGLINASGFHVDPGWEGRLIFTVYNAGANPVTISEGDQLFLIWYATLDQKTVYTYKGGAKGQCRIGSELVERATGQVYSPQTVAAKLSHLERKFETINRWFWRLFIPLVFVFVAAALPVLLEITRENWASLRSGNPTSSLEPSTSVELELRVESSESAESAKVDSGQTTEDNPIPSETEQVEPTDQTDDTRLEPTATVP